MDNITARGYMQDENDVMYPIQNIISIAWNVDGEEIITGNYDNFKLWFTDKELGI